MNTRTVLNTIKLTADFHNYKSLLLVFLSVLISTTELFACTCGTHNSFQLPGVSNATRAFGLSQEGLSLSVGHQTNFFRVRGDNALRTTKKDLELVKSFSVTQLTASYNANPEWGLQLNLPLVSRNYDRFVRFKSQAETETGLGDMSLFASYAAYSKIDCDDRSFVMLFGGLKLPTGDPGSLERVIDQSSTDPSLVLQGRGFSLGTGSVDLPLGVSGYHRSKDFFVLASAQYAFRTTGASDYKFANDITFSLTPGYLAYSSAVSSLSAGITFSGEQKGDDRLAGQKLSRTSLTNFYLGPEIIYIWSKRITAQFGVDLPVSIDVGASAVEPELRVRSAVNWFF